MKPLRRLFRGASRQRGEPQALSFLALGAQAAQLAAGAEAAAGAVLFVDALEDFLESVL